MRDWLENKSLSIHDFMILIDNEILDGFAFQFWVVELLLLKLFLDVSNDEIFRKMRMK